MKNLLLFLALFITLPAMATCSIETGGACSIADIMSRPTERSFSITEPLVKDFSGESSARLQPDKNDLQERELRNFGPQSNDYSYNTNCQFGICNTTGDPKLFMRRDN